MGRIFLAFVAGLAVREAWEWLRARIAALPSRRLRAREVERERRLLEVVADARLVAEKPGDAEVAAAKPKRTWLEEIHRRFPRDYELGLELSEFFRFDPVRDMPPPRPLAPLAPDGPIRADVNWVEQRLNAAEVRDLANELAARMKTKETPDAH